MIDKRARERKKRPKETYRERERERYKTHSGEGVNKEIKRVKCENPKNVRRHKT